MTSAHSPRPLLAPERAIACLKIIRGGRGLITLGRRTAVGREAAAGGLLQGRGLSRVHAWFLRKLDGTVTVVDADSTNGTMVDGRRIETAELREGSMIQLGADVALMLEYRRLAAEAHCTRLTGREQEVALLVSTGLGDAVIAERLGVSRRTVTTHVSRLLSKLQIGNRLDLIQRAQGLAR
ncbi:MAG: FHA domain-containing protein [Nannocystaceae bacterium]|nr:FHA domain-containing protein [Nannocystaceae bacterium]